MTADMISVSRCVALSGLGGDETVLGVARAKRHDELYENYLRRLGEGFGALRDRIVRDIRACLRIGATRLAADLFIVLRLAFARRVMASRDGRRGNARTSVQRENRTTCLSRERRSIRFVAAGRGGAEPGSK